MGSWLKKTEKRWISFNFIHFLAFKFFDFVELYLTWCLTSKYKVFDMCSPSKAPASMKKPFFFFPLKSKILKLVIFQLNWPIDIKSLQNRLLKVCYVPATSTGLWRLLFLLWPLTVLMKQTRQAVCTIKQSILLRCLWTDHICIYYKTFCSCN